MRTRLLVVLSTVVPLALTAVPVVADDVYLVNGRKFEGVVAEMTDSQVRIVMQGGVLSLPLAQVERVEKGDSNLEEYLSRKASLKKGGSAREWLELAEWAKAKELQQASREAAQAAAAIDPQLKGVDAILRGYGYVLDEQLNRWIPYGESMRRRGFVQSGGQWITREEYQARAAAQEAEQLRLRALQQERARAAREDRLTLLAELALVRDLTQPSQPAVPFYPYGAPVVVWPGYFFPGSGGGKPHHFGGHRRDMPTHVPGSLIPGNLISPGAR